MTLTIITTATNGQIRVFVIDENNHKILEVDENETKSVELQAGKSYDIEWHTSAEGNATFTIDGTVQPPNVNDPDFHIKRSDTDQGAFTIHV